MDAYEPGVGESENLGIGEPESSFPLRLFASSTLRLIRVHTSTRSYVHTGSPMC